MLRLFKLRTLLTDVILRCSKSAVILALLVVVAIDLGLRNLSLETLLPCRVGAATEYRAILADLQTRESCDICMVGNSRVAEAIQLPRLRDRIKNSGIDDLTISNYGASLATMEMVRTLSERIIQRGTVRLLIVGVSLEMLVAKPNPKLPYGLFLSPEEPLVGGGAWEKNRKWYISSPHLTLVWQSQMSRFWWLYRFRDRPSQLLEDLWRQLQSYRRESNRPFHLAIDWTALAHGGQVDSPLRGGYPTRQSQEPQRSLRSHPALVENIHRHIVDNFGDEPLGIREENLRELRALLALCKSRGVLPIMLEMPLPKILRDHYSPTLQKDFVNIMNRIEDESTAHFFEWDYKWKDRKEQQNLNEDDFLDFSHLNQRGAQRFTDVLANRLEFYLEPPRPVQ